MKKLLFVPLAALAFGLACGESVREPLAPATEGRLAPSGRLNDDIYNGLDATVDNTAEVMPLNVGGATGTTTLYVAPTNGDGKNGCNLTGGTTLTVSISSDKPSVATVSPTSATFSSCGDTKVLTVTPLTLGTATISVQQTANTTTGSFDFRPATFTVNVAPPINRAPTIAVAGVTAGTAYIKGSVPSATCQVTDAEDGNSSFAATLSAISGSYSADGVGSQTASCSYTDAGGLTASASVTYSIIYDDKTAPGISYLLDPSTPDGLNGWYKLPVTLTWTVTESESPLSLAKTDCVNQSITADQVATTYDCSATSDGGSAAQVSVTIKRDGTAPTVEYTSASPSAPDGTNGWYLGNVTATFTAKDNLAGFGDPASLTTTGTATTSGEGASVTVNSPAFTDNAGNAAASVASDAFKIDKTDPTANATAAPAANANGWNNADVTVTFTGDDGTGSGIAGCSAAASFSSEGAGQTASGKCTDNAGRVSAAKSVTVNIDKTAPTIAAAPTTSPNANGWYNGSVTVSFTCADNLSGFAAGGCPASQSLSTEGTNQSASGTATDKAGNTASASATGINIDLTQPAVSVTGVTDGATYTLGAVPAAACSASDALSGLASSVTPSLTGGTVVNGSVVGAIKATCTATDKAGNVKSATASYKVNFAWTGFFQPVDNDALNTVKAGSAVPVKFSLGGYFGLNIFADGYPKPITIACGTSLPTDDIETTVTAGGSSLTYDATAGQYVYVWKTDSKWAVGTCRQLVLVFADGTQKTALFKAK